MLASVLTWLSETEMWTKTESFLKLSRRDCLTVYELIGAKAALGSAPRTTRAGAAYCHD